MDIMPIILKEKDITFYSIFNRTVYQYDAYYHYRNILIDDPTSHIGKITTFYFDDFETTNDEKIKHYYDGFSGTHYFLSRDKQAIKEIVHNKLFRWKQKQRFKDPTFDSSQINFTYKQIICDLKHARI
jgi:hypothetical protein